MANIFKWFLMRFYSSRSEHSGAYQETMSFQGRRRVESILIMRGKDNLSFYSGCVIWKEQKTWTCATSTISFTVFLHLVGGSCRRESSLDMLLNQQCVCWARGALAGSCVHDSQQLLGSAFTTWFQRRFQNTKSQSHILQESREGDKW